MVLWPEINKDPFMAVYHLIFITNWSEVHVVLCILTNHLEPGITRLTLRHCVLWFACLLWKFYNLSKLLQLNLMLFVLGEGVQFIILMSYFLQNCQLLYQNITSSLTEILFVFERIHHFKFCSPFILFMRPSSTPKFLEILH